jgi:DNA-binding CsgD family transcriptional regulator
MIYSIVFQSLLAIAVVAVGLFYGRNPNGLGNLAFYATPVAIVITAVFSFLPSPLHAVLFTASPIFMAPALVRRAYGVIGVSPPGRTLWTFMSSNAAAVGFMLVVNHMVIPDGFMKITDSEPFELMFLMAALLALIAWVGIRRTIKFESRWPGKIRPGLSKSLMFWLVAVVLVAFWMRVMNNLIDWNVEQYDDFLGVPVYVVIPILAFLLFGYLGDRGRERAGILNGLIIFIISVQLAFFLVANINSMAAIPLVVVNHFIHFYIMYFILTITVSFIPYAKQPVFMASLSIGLYMLSRLFTKLTEVLLPPQMQEAGAPLFVSMAITAIVFLILVQYIYQRYRGKTLAASLYALMSADSGSAVSSPPTEALASEGAGAGAGAEAGAGAKADAYADESANVAMPVAVSELADTTAPTAPETPYVTAGLNQEEIRVAMLLINETSGREIARKLSMTAAEVDAHMNAIRRKMNIAGDYDPRSAAAAAKYRLTKRETEIMQFLRRNANNDEIAGELFLSKETVKTHVRNIMKKLPVETRQDIPAWLESFSDNQYL